MRKLRNGGTWEAIPAPPFHVFDPIIDIWQLRSKESSRSLSKINLDWCRFSANEQSNKEKSPDDSCISYR